MYPLAFGQNGGFQLTKAGVVFGQAGEIVDPITASYDAILATEPTVPLLFRLTEYRGQQILFQDSACTVPVESIGDPVGGVRHPETGEILAVQTADANRPIWGGVDVGLVFDGGTANILFSDNFSTFTAAHIYTSIILTNDPPLAGETGLWSLNPSGSSDTAAPFTDGNIYESAFTDTRANAVDPGVDMSLNYNVYEVVSDAVSYDHRMNGVLLQSLSARFNIPRSAPELGYSRSNVGSIRRLSGNLRGLVLFDARQTEGTSAIIREGLL